MKKLSTLIVCSVALAGCTTVAREPGATFDRISDEVAQAAARPRAPSSASDDIGQAMLPPLQLDLPAVDKKPEARFDLEVTNTPAAQVFMALVADTQYSMLFSPELSGSISLKLKAVTLREALDTIRDIYGYEYKIQGTRIFIQPNTLHSRVFQINYLASRRKGDSELSISSSTAPIANNPSAQAAAPTSLQSTSTYQNGTYAYNGTVTTGYGPGTRVQTTSEVDFWRNLEFALNAIVGTPLSGNPANTASADGAASLPISPGSVPGVVINTVSGIIVVRAMPREMRLVENYLRATQAIVERQVMLEAKILEVSLSQGYQSGVNWAAFGSGSNSNFAIGTAAAGSTLRPLVRGTPGTAAGSSVSTTNTVTNTTRVFRDSSGNIIPYDPASPTTTSGSNTLGTLTTTTTTTPATAATAAVARALTGGLVNVTPGLAGSVAASSLGKGFIGLAFQTSNFATLLNFLETQGNVQVLSSPRIATINNQKAVLKVGTDQVYITGFRVVQQTSMGTATTTTSAIPTPETSTLFSGISLDVTPQIDDDGNIVLHVHPAVSKVSEVERSFRLGSAGDINIPLASRDVNETDSIVRVKDGQIVAIGGLMSQDQTMDRSGLPGTTGAAAGVLVGQRGATLNKRELVILLKPTIISSDAAWAKDLEETSDRLRRYDPRNLREERH